MFEVEHVTCLSAAPLRVWTALSDLAGFARWHPFIRLSGAAVEGGAIGYTFNTTFLRKAMTAPATITQCRKPEEIGWKTGMPGLLMFEEAFRIDAITSGTQMRHSTRCWGPFSRVATSKLKGGSWRVWKRPTGHLSAIFGRVRPWVGGSRVLIAALPSERRTRCSVRRNAEVRCETGSLLTDIAPGARLVCRGCEWMLQSGAIGQSA